MVSRENESDGCTWHTFSGMECDFLLHSAPLTFSFCHRNMNEKSPDIWLTRDFDGNEKHEFNIHL